MQPSQLIVTAPGNEEQVFFAALAERLRLKAVFVRETVACAAALGQDPGALLFWDLDDALSNPERFKAWTLLLKERGIPERVFALCDDLGAAYSQAFDAELPFSHAIRRRLGSKGLELLARVVAAAGEEYPLGLDRYFPDGAFSQSIRLKRSEHRAAAVDAMQSFLRKSGVKPRVAAAAAQAVDELLMNAIFNAPHDEAGNPTRRNLARGAAFDLHRTEHVELEVMVCDRYLGLRVTDLFGRLERDTVTRVFSRDFREEAYVPKSSQRDAGLGLRGILGSGFSLLFVCKPGSCTDAMVFWPAAASHVEFKRGFQFAAYYGRPSAVAARRASGGRDR